MAGVAVDSVEDMKILFDGVPPDGLAFDDAAVGVMHTARPPFEPTPPVGGTRARLDGRYGVEFPGLLSQA